MDLLATVAQGRGNLLLNVGPMADGTIPPLMEERLLQIGAWLKVNGEAIYGTRPAPRTAQWTGGERPKQEYGEYMVKYDLMDQIGQQPRDGRAVKQVFFTRKPDVLFAITAGWPGAKLVLRDVTIPPGTRVTLLGHDAGLRWARVGNDVEITLPDFGPEDAPCEHAFVIKIPGGSVKPE